MGEPFDETTDLAKQRTLLAGERTLMAWIRTSVSMAGFGFAIYKFFQYLIQSGLADVSLRGPRELGLTLIGFGITSLAVGVIEYMVLHKRIHPYERVWALFRLAPVIVAILLGIIELALFMTLLSNPEF